MAEPKTATLARAFPRRPDRARARAKKEAHGSPRGLAAGARPFGKPSQTAGDVTALSRLPT